MIEATIGANTHTDVIRTLQSRAARIGHQRAEYLAQALRSSEHRWRSPAALWPELGLE
ncbi:MAG: hypothetical protein AAGE86_03435 [Pseudomonadota bacterium]